MISIIFKIIQLTWASTRDWSRNQYHKVLRPDTPSYCRRSDAPRSLGFDRSGGHCTGAPAAGPAKRWPPAAPLLWDSRPQFCDVRSTATSVECATGSQTSELAASSRPAGGPPRGSTSARRADWRWPSPAPSWAPVWRCAARWSTGWTCQNRSSSPYTRTRSDGNWSRPRPCTGRSRRRFPSSGDRKRECAACN